MSVEDDLYADIIQNDPLLRDLASKMTDSIVRGFEKSMDDQMNELFGLATFVPEQNKNLSIDELLKTAELLEPAPWLSRTPAQAWARDPDACRKEDMKLRRGHLILNPEAGVASMEGNITEKDGVEYRVLLDECLRGTRNDDGSIRWGYWVDPMPPIDLTVPIVVEPKRRDKWDEISIRSRMLSYPPINHTIMGLGVDVVDHGPVPLDMVAAELPRATLHQQKRTLVQVWRNWRDIQIAQGEKPYSLKEYARQSRWGRRWLERKRKL